MNRFANLADKPRKSGPSEAVEFIQLTTIPPSWGGREAISGYFSPELSMALHHCARWHERSLQMMTYPISQRTYPIVALQQPATVLIVKYHSESQGVWN